MKLRPAVYFLHTARLRSYASKQIASPFASRLPLNKEFSSTSIRVSGHSRWSKIKHDKAKADAKLEKQRSQLAKDIELASKEGGPDIRSNPRLATVLAAAKKAGFPKASYEAAIARGQGRSPSGAVLDPMTIEVLHSPTGAALIVDCLTDNKAKTLQTVREKLKSNEAAQAPVSYMFERRGRLQFGPGSTDEQYSLESDAIMDAALSAGAIDVDFGCEAVTTGGAGRGETNESIVYTEPSQLALVAESMSKELGIQPLQTELTWYPNEDMIVESGDGPPWEQLGRLIDQLEDDWTVSGVYMNVR